LRSQDAVAGCDLLIEDDGSSGAVEEQDSEHAPPGRNKPSSGRDEGRMAWPEVNRRGKTP
jgi:hypothetical protein